MLRRPPTNIELKLDDMREYEAVRNQLAAAKDADKSKQTDTLSLIHFQPMPKSKEEIYSRIGYNPDKTPPAAAPQRGNLL